jgi:hypothetical protein
VTTTDLDAIRADALAGPWQALVLDECGDPFDEESFAELLAHTAAGDPTDVTVVVVRDSALEPNSDGQRLTGAYDVLDLLCEWRAIEEPDEALARWEQAKAVAAALNARAGAVVPA